MSWFAPSSDNVYQQDAAEWKKRALAAEAKLSGYRRLREIGEEILRSVCERDAAAKARAIDAMSEELSTLEVVDAPKNPFVQTIDLGDGKQLEVRLRAGLGSCSTLDTERGVIEVEALQPTEGRVVGLLFQLVQLSDVAVAVLKGQETKLDERYLHAIVCPLAYLLTELGLLRIDDITGASLGAHIATIVDMTSKDPAASGVKG